MSDILNSISDGLADGAQWVGDKAVNLGSGLAGVGKGIWNLIPDVDDKSSLLSGAAIGGVAATGLGLLGGGVLGHLMGRRVEENRQNAAAAARAEKEAEIEKNKELVRKMLMLKGHYGEKYAAVAAALPPETTVTDMMHEHIPVDDFSSFAWGSALSGVPAGMLSGLLAGSIGGLLGQRGAESRFKQQAADEARRKRIDAQNDELVRQALAMRNKVNHT